MKIKCANCKKNFDMEKYYGICPKCCAFNRPSAADQQHKEYHSMYDNGYNHSEQAAHQVHHDYYDNGYSHNEPHNRGMADNDVDRYSPYRNQPDITQKKRKMPLVMKIVLIIFIINIIGPILYFLIWSLGFFAIISS